MDDKELITFKVDLRALLQSAGRMGLTLEEIERDYFDLFKESLPYWKFGAESTEQLLSNLSDTVQLLRGDGGSRPDVYYAVSDQSTRHLEGLIDRQRVHAPTRFGGVIPEVLADRNEPRLINRPNQQVLTSITNTQVLAQPQRPGYGTGYVIGPGYASVVRGNNCGAGNQRENMESRGSLKEVLSQRLQSISGGSNAVQPQKTPAMISRGLVGSVSDTKPIIAQQTPELEQFDSRPLDEQRDVLMRRLREMTMIHKDGQVRTASAAQQRLDVLNGPSTAVPGSVQDYFQQNFRTNSMGPRFQYAQNTSTAMASSSLRNPAPNDFPMSSTLTVQPKENGISASSCEVTKVSPSAVSELDIPSGAEAGSLNITSEKQRQNSLDSAVSQAPEFPEEAPLLLSSQMPAGVKIPRPLWETIYAILREHGNWMDVRQFQSEYARRTHKPLSAEYLQKNCGIKSFKQMFTDIPLIQVQHTPDEVMYARLLAPSLARKNVAICNVKPRYMDTRPQTAGGVAHPCPGTGQSILYDDDDDDEDLLIPKAPQVDSCKNYRPDVVPQDLRSQIYHLLWNHFRNGIDISTFSENYTKRYGASLNTVRDCGMELSAVLYCMADLVDLGKADDGKIWIRPLPYNEVRRRYEQQRKKRRQAEANKRGKVLEE